jgi:peptidoglycan/LPS O-acetylase OafA/YrhL
MLSMDLPDVEDSVGLEDPAASAHARGYLEMLNLFRVVACAAVLGQHAFIWTNMSGNFIGTAFITMLHLSRTSFFFLTGLVVCYAQITHPRSLGNFWRRRYVEVGVPYLAWTAIYLIFSIITVSTSWDEVGRFLRHNLFLGFSQMYFIVVLFQFYLVFPLLLKFLRSTRRHGRVFAVSVAFSLLLGMVEHYPFWFPSISHFIYTVNSVLPLSRDIFAYQEFLVAGVLVALHFDDIVDFVSRRYQRIMTIAAVVGLLTVLWYMISVWTGSSVERASDIYEPLAVVWCLAAIAGIFSLSWWWESRGGRPRPAIGERTLPTTAYWASLTGGVFFAHTLFIDMIRAALSASGLRAALPWEFTVVILFAGTVIAAATLSALVLRSPLRWVLGGPVRSEQRASYDATYELRPAVPRPY